MKKLLSLLLSMSVLLSGCSVLEEEVRQESVIPTETVEPEIAEQPVELSETEQQIRGLYSEYYPVLFIVKYKSNLLFNTDTTLKLYVDGEEVAELMQGDTSAYGTILPKGTHKLKIASSWLNADSYKFTVGEDAFLGNVLNYFDITVQFKMNEAAIESIDGNTMTYNSTSYDAEENYNYAQTMVDLALHHAIGNFDYVLNQYKYRQINDAVIERHISTNMDEWSWLDRGILFNLPAGMEKEPISLSDEELAEYSTSAGLKLLNDNCEATLSIGVMEEMVNSGLEAQISDLFTEAELQDMAAADIAEDGTIVESLETALSEYGEFKVFEGKYTIVDGGIRKTGYSFCFFVDFAFCKARFETSDESILDAIIGSINLYGTTGLSTVFTLAENTEDTMLESMQCVNNDQNVDYGVYTEEVNNPNSPIEETSVNDPLFALWGKWFHDDTEDYGKWTHEITAERFVTIDSYGSSEDSLVIDTFYIAEDVLHVYFSVGTDRNFYCVVSGNTMALYQTWNKPDYGPPVIYVREGTSSPELNILQHAQEHGVSVVGYDYNGEALYIGSIVRIAVDEDDLQYALGAVVQLIEDGILIVEFLGVFDTDEYQQEDYYYLGGIKEQFLTEKVVCESVHPSLLQIHAWS